MSREDIEGAHTDRAGRAEYGYTNHAVTPVA
jgi:hypothetical protein